jgi:hypothetical protein
MSFLLVLTLPVGKSKYGGPFTTEQVEDVKTLLRLLPLISIFGVIASVFIAATYLQTSMKKYNAQFSASIAECYSEASLTKSVHFGIFLLIVLHEFVIKFILSLYFYTEYTTLKVYGKS